MIGFYDSGIGGLAIWEKFIQDYPNIKSIYYADTAHNPLGEKSPTKIRKIVKKAVFWLFDQGCNLVILPCNTATAVALRWLQQEIIPVYYPGRNVLGIVRPFTETISQLNTPIVLLATQASIDSGYYQTELSDSTNIQYISCPGLAQKIESHQNTFDTLVSVLTQVQNKSNITHIVLACTHYPIIKAQILLVAMSLGFDTKLVCLDQVEITRSKLKQYLDNHPEYPLEKGRHSIVSSGSGNFTKCHSSLFPFLLTINN